MIDFSEHFCKGDERWKSICFECKYPKERRTEMLLEELKDYQKRLMLGKNKINSLTKMIRRVIKEKDFYKKSLSFAIEDIEWAKKNRQISIGKELK